MPRSLADGHIKVAILTTKPANPAAPTVTELTAGIDASCAIMASDFAFGATDSDKVAEKALCVTNNAQALGAGNYTAAMTLFRYFDATTKNADATADTAFAAVETKGTTLWVYARETAKLATEAWAASDEIYLGAEVITDTPQPPSDRGGFIKRRTVMEVQDAHDNITAVAP